MTAWWVRTIGSEIHWDRVLVLLVIMTVGLFILKANIEWWKNQ